MIADIVVIAIICLSAYVGYKRGIVKTISGLFCFIVSVFVAKLLYSRVSVFVSDSAIGEAIRGLVGDKTQIDVGDKAELFQKYIQQAGVQASDAICEMLITITSVIAIIIITFFLTKLVASALNIFSRLPVISLFNRLFGLAIGAVIGCLVAYLVVAVFVFGDIQGVDKWMDNSVIAYKMYTENLLFDLIF